jgi:hypothetical protein
MQVDEANGWPLQQDAELAEQAPSSRQGLKQF